MTIVRVGTNQKYAEGWDAAFGGKKSGAKGSSKPAPKKASPKKSGKKSKK